MTAAPPAPPALPWREAAAVGALAAVGFVAWTLRAGQDLNWDLRNYHFWSAHAFLTGTTFEHLAPGLTVSWLNPLLQVPSYLAIRHLPPWAAAATEALFPVPATALLYLLSFAVLAPRAPAQARAGALIATLIGVTGAAGLSEVGTSFVDGWIAAFVVGGLLALVRGRPGLAGLVLGLGCGLKPTLAVYALAVGSAPLGAPGSWADRARTGWAYAVGLLFGFLVAAGPWAVAVGREFGNPFFPFMNHLFGSPDFPSVELLDRRFVPQGLADVLQAPFRWAAGHLVSSEVPLREPRYLAVLLLAAATLVARAVGKPASPDPPPAAAPARMLGWAFAAGSILHFLKWGYLRYMIPSELLAGPLLVVLAQGLLPAGLPPVPALAGLALALGLATGPGNWGRVPFRADYFEVRAPPSLLSGAPLLVLVPGNEPVSFVLPSLAPGARAVRLTGVLPPVDPATPFGARIAARLAAAPGPLVAVSVGPLGPPALALLAGHRLAPRPGAPLETLTAGSLALVVTPLERAPPLDPERPASPAPSARQ